jgi:hypothetical protein
MGKRKTGVRKHGKITSHKTKKRLEVKRLMLIEKAKKPSKRNK